MSGAKVAGQATWRRDTPLRVIMMASPRTDQGFSATHMTSKTPTRLYILPLRKTRCIRNNTLRSKQIILPRATFPDRHPDRPDTIRVSKRNDPKSCQHRDARIRALHLFHHAPDSRKNVLFVDAELSSLLQIVREDVKQELRVGRSVDMPMRGRVHELH